MENSGHGLLSTPNENHVRLSISDEDSDLKLTRYNLDSNQTPPYVQRRRKHGIDVLDDIKDESENEEELASFLEAFYERIRENCLDEIGAEF